MEWSPLLKYGFIIMIAITVLMVVVKMLPYIILVLACVGGYHIARTKL